MPCNIVACVKQVPHPDDLSNVSIDLETGTMTREGVPAIINPSDRNALEEALRIKEKLSGRVIAMTMGPPQAKKALEDALAMGADAAIHLCDRAFAGADTLATARALAYGIRKLDNFDLILCGDTTIDSGTGQVAVQLAEFIDLPCIIEAEELTLESEQSLIVKRKWERGYVKVRTKLPAVIAVSENVNQPRLPTLMDIMTVAQKEITDWCAADTNADPGCLGPEGSPTEVFEMGEFHAKRQGEVLQGSPEEVVDAAIDRLAKLEVL